MANSKSRLGRGLQNLISGSVSSPAKKDPPPRKNARKAAVRKTAEPKKKTPPKPRAAAPKKGPAPAAEESARATPLESQKPKDQAEESRGGLREIAVKDVVPNPHQPRKDFDDTRITELAESIRSEGLIQPIVVRQVGEQYELIAGERRWRACRMLKMKRIPARILETTESSSAVMSLIENLQRENLNPIEEALGYASLMADFDLTQEAVSERVGKARASVANSLRLLQFDKEIQQYISKRLLSSGHAKVLLGLESQDAQSLVARQVIERQLSVRETEKLVQHQKRGASIHSPTTGRTVPADEQAALADLEKRLTQSLSTRVELRHNPRKGKILIEYYGNDDLHRILERIGVSL